MVASGSQAPSKCHVLAALLLQSGLKYCLPALLLLPCSMPDALWVHRVPAHWKGRCEVRAERSQVLLGLWSEGQRTVSGKSSRGGGENDACTTSNTGPTANKPGTPVTLPASCILLYQSHIFNFTFLETGNICSLFSLHKIQFHIWQPVWI